MFLFYYLLSLFYFVLLFICLFILYVYSRARTAYSSIKIKQLSITPPINRIKIAATSERLAVMTAFLSQLFCPDQNHFLLSFSNRPDSRIFWRLCRDRGKIMTLIGYGCLKKDV